MKKKIFLAFLLITIVFVNFQSRAADLPGEVKLEFNQTGEENIFKVVVYAASTSGVRDFDIIFSYDNRLMKPYDYYEQSTVDIVHDDETVYPIKRLAQDRRETPYTLNPPLWKIHGDRTALRASVSITNTNNVDKTKTLLPMFEVYFSFIGDHTTDDFSKGTFKVESAWGTSSKDSFLMDFFNEKDGAPAKDAEIDRAPLAIKMADTAQTMLYGMQANGTESQIAVSYDYPNSTKTTLGKIQLSVENDVDTVYIPADAETEPNKLKITAKLFDEDGDDYELKGEVLWSVVASGPKNVVLDGDDPLEQLLVINPGEEEGTVKINVTIEGKTASITLDVERHASVVTDIKFYYSDEEIVDSFEFEMPTTDKTQGLIAQVFDQYGFGMSNQTIAWIYPSTTNVTFTPKNAGSELSLTIDNTTQAAEYGLTAKAGDVERDLEIRFTKLICALEDSITFPETKYTGSKLMPEPTIKDGDYTLVENTDYNIEYPFENIEAGKHKTIITGLGLYKDTLEKDFTISKATYSGELKYSTYVVSNTDATGKTYNLREKVEEVAGFKNLKFKNPSYVATGLLTGSPSATETGVKFDVTSQPAGQSGQIKITVENQNYEDVEVLLTVTTTDVDPVWTAVDTLFKTPEYVYGDRNDKIDLPISGTAKAGDEILEGSFSYKDGATIQDSGSKTIAVVFTVTTDGQYKGVTIEKNYTVNIAPKPITVVADDKVKKYGEDNPALAFSVNSDDLVGNDTETIIKDGLTLSTKAGKTSDVGVYDITGEDSDPNDNYVITVTKGKLTIDKAKITSILSGGPVVTLDADNPKNKDLTSLLGLVDSDTVTVEYGDSQQADLAVSWKFEEGTVFDIKGKNYVLNSEIDFGSNFLPYDSSSFQTFLNVNPITGTLKTVIDKNVTIAKATRDAATFYTEFDLPSSIEFTLSRADLGDQTYSALKWDMSLDDLRAIPVDGSAVVTLVQSTDDGNVPSWLTIDPVSITVNITEKHVIPSTDITVASKTITYGEAFDPVAENSASIANADDHGNPVVTYSYTVKATGEELAEQPKDAGEYLLVATYESDTHIGSNSADFIINPKKIKVVIENKERIYGAENPELTWILDPSSILAFAEEEKDLLVELTCLADEKSPAKTPVDITGDSTNTNYKITFVGETDPNDLTVNVGILTIKMAPIDAMTPVITTVPPISPVPIGYDLIASLPGVDDTELTWQWYKEETLIVGETNKTYTVKIEDSNKKFTVEAIAKGINYEKTSLISDSIAIERAEVQGPVTIKLLTDADNDGKISVADTIEAVNMFVPDVATKFSYKWFIDGKEVAGQTNQTYLIQPEDSDKEISVEINVDEDYQGSAKSAEFKIGKMILDTSFKIDDPSVLTPGVGDQLNVDVSNLVVGSNLIVKDQDFTIVWLRNGQPIQGETEDSYTLKKEDLGQTVAVKLVAAGDYTGEGFATNSFTIAAAKPEDPILNGSADDRVINVYWSEPFDNGSPITHYTLQLDTENPIVIAAGITRHQFKNLKNGQKYDVYLTAHNLIGDSATVTRSFTPVEPEEEYVPVIPPKPPVDEVPVLIDGQEKQLATQEEKTSETGKTETIITVSEDIEEALDEASAAEPKVGLEFTKPADTYTSVLPAKGAKAMKDKGTVLEIKTPEAIFELPLDKMDLEEKLEKLYPEADLADLRVIVTIGEADEETVAEVEKALETAGLNQVVAPVRFKVSAEYEDEIQEIGELTGFATRTIILPEGTDPTLVTTAVTVDEEGNVFHLPTQVIEVDGQIQVRVNAFFDADYTVIYNTKTFADIETHWAKESIEDMAARLIVNGVNQENYEPKRDITRAEFAAIIIRSLGLKPEMSDQVFSDVELDKWYADVVYTAVKHGLIQGYADGTFDPDAPITREQAMTIIWRAMKLTILRTDYTAEEADLIIGVFKDNDEVAKYAQEAIAACVDNGIVQGRSQDEIDAKESITRAEVAVLVQRMLETANLI